jgi:hypothetical protein
MLSSIKGQSLSFKRCSAAEAASGDLPNNFSGGMAIVTMADNDGKAHADVGELLREAAAALHEAASLISSLEVRIQQLEAATVALAPLPVLAPDLQPARQQQPEIDAESRTHVTTSVAARWLNRQPQTLRKWACHNNGPLQPVRINGRLAWAVAEIRNILLPDDTSRGKTRERVRASART